MNTGTHFCSDKFFANIGTHTKHENRYPMNIGTQHALDNSLTHQTPATDEWWEESGARDIHVARPDQNSRGDCGIRGWVCRISLYIQAAGRIGRQVKVYKQHR